MKIVSKDSKTYENLMTAFAGESMARNKYDYYASTAKKEGYVQIAAIFEETANQEKEHAKLEYKYIGGIKNTIENLKDAIEGENYEWSTMYKDFAVVADEEGYTEVAESFRKIAEVEYEHEKRYAKFLENLEKDQVFKKDKSVRWQCRNCGYVHEGEEAPDMCPACFHKQAHFEVMKTNY